MSGLSLQHVYEECCRSLQCHPNSGLRVTLPQDASVTSLDLSKNVVGPLGLLPVLAVAKNAPRLTHLNLSGNKLDNSSVRALAAALQSHGALTSLHLNRNRISEEGGLLLKQLVATNANLVDVQLSETLINPATIRAVERRAYMRILGRQWRRENGVPDTPSDAPQEELESFMTAPAAPVNTPGGITMGEWEFIRTLVCPLGALVWAKEVWWRADPTNKGELMAKELVDFAQQIPVVKSLGTGHITEAYLMKVLRVDSDNKKTVDFWEFLAVELHRYLGLEGKVDMPEFTLFVTDTFRGERGACVIRTNPSRPKGGGTGGQVNPSISWDTFREIRCPLSRLVFHKLLWEKMDPHNKGTLATYEIAYYAELHHRDHMQNPTLARMLRQVEPENNGMLNFWQYLGLELFWDLKLEGQVDLQEWVHFCSESYGGGTRGVIRHETQAQVRAHMGQQTLQRQQRFLISEGAPAVTVGVGPDDDPGVMGESETEADKLRRAIEENERQLAQLRQENGADTDRTWGNDSLSHSDVIYRPPTEPPRAEQSSADMDKIILPLGTLVHWKKCFQRCDPAGVGSLTTSGVLRWAEPSGLQHIPTSSLLALVECCDVESSGSVDFWGFLALQVYITVGLAAHGWDLGLFAKHLRVM